MALHVAQEYFGLWRLKLAWDLKIGLWCPGHKQSCYHEARPEMIPLVKQFGALASPCNRNCSRPTVRPRFRDDSFVEHGHL